MADFAHKIDHERVRVRSHSSHDPVKVPEDIVVQILTMIEEAPRSMSRKVRARVGEKVPWYELPEADKEIVN